MKIAVLKETRPHEARVSATPETVKKYIALGAEVVVESGAGEGASILDSAYTEAGAKIAKSAADAAKGADIVLKVAPPRARSEGLDEISYLGSESLLISQLDPYKATDSLAAYAKAGVSAFAMELMPRISRAQSMDVLSSQSNLAGYKAVLDAAAVYGRAFPMMMTAAGKVLPANVFVMGAGVAGLQAIATAKRLGAVVSATDVRPVVKEQVESLGGKFIMVNSEETKEAQTAGGYAKEMSDEYKKQQAALIADHIAKVDVVICTALIPGRPAPVLMTEAMVKSMKQGSVIVDLAVEQGGNCPLSEAGKVVVKHGVTLVGHLNVPSRLAAESSALYARNLLNFITLLIDKETKKLVVPWEDELVIGTLMTKGGEVVHARFKDTVKDVPKSAVDAGKTDAAPAKKKDTTAK